MIKIGLLNLCWPLLFFSFKFCHKNLHRIFDSHYKQLCRLSAFVWNCLHQVAHFHLVWYTIHEMTKIMRRFFSKLVLLSVFSSSRFLLAIRMRSIRSMCITQYNDAMTSQHPRKCMDKKYVRGSHGTCFHTIYVNEHILQSENLVFILLFVNKIQIYVRKRKSFIRFCLLVLNRTSNRLYNKRFSDQAICIFYYMYSNMRSMYIICIYSYIRICKKLLFVSQISTDNYIFGKKMF